MRLPLIAFLTLGLAAALAAQDDARKDPLAARYALTVNALTYPQETPGDALKSVVRTIETRRLEYLVAQLADPRLVDARIAEYRDELTDGSAEARTFRAFERLLQETDRHFIADPQILRELRLFARDAEWQVNEDQAVGSAKDIPEHKVYMRRFGARWFLENRQQ